MTEARTSTTPIDLALEPAPHLISIPSFSDHRGTLCVIDWEEKLPFTPQRLYYIHNVTEGAKRAGHAHFQGEELIVCFAGAVRVLVDNGRRREEFLLSRPDIGLYIPRMVWHHLDGFGCGAVCAVLASGRYREEDYCRDFQQFLERSAE